MGMFSWFLGEDKEPEVELEIPERLLGDPAEPPEFPEPLADPRVTYDEEGRVSSMEFIPEARPDQLVSRSLLTSVDAIDDLAPAIGAEIEDYDHGDLQRFLRTTGYYSGPIDNDFGNGSQRALAEFINDFPEEFAELFHNPSAVTGGHLSHLIAEDPDFLDGIYAYVDSVTQENPAAFIKPLEPVHHGLSPDYTANNLLRALAMTGHYDGRIDGAVGNGAEEAIASIHAQYPSVFSEIDINDYEAVYNRIRELGPDAMLESPSRVTMDIRATGTDNPYSDRTMVNGEIIMRNHEAGTTFFIEQQDNGGYTSHWLTEEDAMQMRASGANIFYPEFNSGSLNFTFQQMDAQGNPMFDSEGNAVRTSRGRSYMSAQGEFNPYDGNALPGFAGGTLYQLNWGSAIFNGTIKPSFADGQGRASWLHFSENYDPEILQVRDRDGQTRTRNEFGFHVDGQTVGAYGPNDGTSGCPGVDPAYAHLFFDALDDMNSATRPTHVRLARPSESAPAPDNPRVAYSWDPDQSNTDIWLADADPAVMSPLR